MDKTDDNTQKYSGQLLDKGRHDKRCAEAEERIATMQFLCKPVVFIKLVFALLSTYFRC